MLILLTKKMNKDIDKFLNSIGNSKFRGSFHLNKKMKEYVFFKGMDEIKHHAYEIVTSRLAPSDIKNDGKQTPMKQVHPIFIAQHATGCCCRGCIERIHRIPKCKELSKEEIDYIVSILIRYIENECSKEVDYGKRKN